MSSRSIEIILLCGRNVFAVCNTKNMRIGVFRRRDSLSLDRDTPVGLVAR
jgi:hypothetical protein